MSCILLTDGSVDPKLGIGFGSYLVLDEIPASSIGVAERVKTKRFEKTSSTQLELQTLLWALNELSGKSVRAFTDSQNIPSLMRRREDLIKNNFCSKSGKPHKNHELYRHFFEAVDSMNIQFHWLSGHKPSRQKNSIDHLFTLVDRTSRNALRSFLKAMP